MTPSLRHSAGRILPLAWPVLVGQLAVLAFGTVDTVLVARASATDLAALAIGGAAYITVFIGLMGVVLAIGPIAGQLFGAKQLRDAGRQLHQAGWLALALSVVGCAVMLFPQPFLALSRASPEVGEKVRGYLAALAFALPPALLFTAFRGFNTSVSRPKIVMAVQLGGLAMKVPLSAWLVFGGLGLQPLGAVGCGIATAIVMWGQLAIAWWVIHRDPFYAPFGLHDGGIARPDRESQKALVRLGVPMGLSVLIEVTGFTFMAFFIARMGTTAVAGHQLAANLIAMLFMVPLSLGNATATLVAQRIGAADMPDARRLGWHGLQIALLVAALLGSGVYLAREGVLGLYTSDAAIIAAALPLLAWVAVFHIADAGQALTSFVLRAHRVTTVPLLIYAFAIWGVGLAGGYVLAFDTFGSTPPALLGARGFWAAATAGLAVAALGLGAFLQWVLRQRAADAAA
ncbi:MATE family efflux transporter [Piscinibacter gummiphilus]|uniref:MATE family efflux transporter n=1 Tax=Piscinibacter gummiphilus TaxID=946333 RepID=A0A1W6LDZ6_9BURK|nr:MATE family efflux transporter [Piscinibacter gummiphilus]ARN22453.1 MATE family efflux transporter [Piscinibacter gummiphilus]ATU67148.1 MATE family efflux transporter [Piscinibacter gummiphilus]GLS98035.1 MATE family efflux transporter [Piscinibacter gummiphilus]